MINLCRKILPVVSLVGLGSSCLEQYNPRGWWKQFEEERIQAHTAEPQLNDDGTLPVQASEGEGEEVELEPLTMDEALTLYANNCASCHGDQGAGDGQAGLAMNPKPRSFLDPSWQDSVDDAHIVKVIWEGGTAVGLNALMIARPDFNRAQVDGLVKVVRSFRQDP